MAQSRREKFIPIFQRVAGLIKSGALKYESRPLWYDVYEAYPPKMPPVMNRKDPQTVVKTILYKEDAVRAEFLRTWNVRDISNLFEGVDNSSETSKVIETARQLSESNHYSTMSELMSAVQDKLKENKITLKTKAQFNEERKSNVDRRSDAKS